MENLYFYTILRFRHLSETFSSRSIRRISSDNEFYSITQTEKDMCTFFIFDLPALRPRYAVRPRPVWTYLYTDIFTFSLQSPWMKLAFLLHFISPCKTFTSHVTCQSASNLLCLLTTPWGGATSLSASNVLCLLTFAWRRKRIALTLNARVPTLGCS